MWYALGNMRGENTATRQKQHEKERIHEDVGQSLSDVGPCRAGGGLDADRRAAERGGGTLRGLRDRRAQRQGALFREREHAASPRLSHQDDDALYRFRGGRERRDRA